MILKYYAEDCFGEATISSNFCPCANASVISKVAQRLAVPLIAVTMRERRRSGTPRTLLPGAHAFSNIVH